MSVVPRSIDGRQIVGVLAERGLLLMQDGELPNVVALVVGENVAGSWWSHEARHEIFRVANELAEHPDVCIATLIDGKRTFVHRTRWPALIALGRAREPWQLARLDKSARELLARIDAQGEVVSTGASARQLERALLVASEEFHMPNGRHAKQLMTWARFADQRLVPPVRIDAQRAKLELEEVAERLAAATQARCKLPWQA